MVDLVAVGFPSELEETGEAQREMVDLVAAWPEPKLIYDVALELRVSEVPGAVDAVVARIGETHPVDEPTLAAFSDLVDHLLDGTQARPRTVEALGRHAASPTVTAVIARGSGKPR